MADVIGEVADRAVPGRVVEVQLFEDRASVTRAFEVVPGRQRIVLGPLSPLISERRLSFPSGNLEVEDVRVVRERRTRVDADPAALAGLEAAVREAEAKALAVRQALGRARDRCVRAHGLVETALAATPRAWVEAGARFLHVVDRGRRSRAHQNDVARIGGRC